MEQVSAPPPPPRPDEILEPENELSEYTEIPKQEKEPFESFETPEQKKERLEAKKLELEIRDLNKPLWQRLLENPQFITAFITTVGALVAAFLLIDSNYFEKRKQALNAEAATAKYEAALAQLNARQATDDAVAKTKAAKALTDKANQEIADADTKKREAKVKLDSMTLALASEDVLSEIRNDHAPKEFPLARLNQARSMAWEAWRKGQSEQTRHAILLAYSRPTDVLLGNGRSGVKDADFSADRKALITSGSPDGDAVYLFRIADGKFKRETDGKPSVERLEDKPYSGEYHAILSPDQRFAAAVFKHGKNGELRIWERTKEGFNSPGSQRDFLAADPFPDNLNPPPAFSKTDSLAFESPDGIVQVWSTLTGIGSVAMTDCQGKPYPRGLKFSPDGGLLAVGQLDGSVHFCDPNTGKEVNEPILPGKHDAKQLLLGDIDFSRDGNRILIASGTPGSEIWYLSTLRHCALQIQDRIPGPFAGKTLFSLDPKSRYVFAIEGVNEGGTYLTTAIAWNGENCALKKVLEHDKVKDIQLSADGSRVLILSNKSMSVFDANSLEKLSTLEYECEDTKAAISGDGRFVAAWSYCYRPDSNDSIVDKYLLSIYTAVTEKDIDRFPPKD